MMKLIHSVFLFMVVVVSVNGINKTYHETKAVTSNASTKEQPKSVLFQSSDNGNTWQSLGSGLPESLQVASAFAQNGELFLGSASGVLYHSRNPKSGLWEQEVIDETYPKEAIIGIFKGPSGLYVCLFEQGFYRKKPGTDTWQPMHKTLKEKTVYVVLEKPDGSIFIACPGGIYVSRDDGKTWKHVLKKLWVTSLTSSGNVLVCNGSGGLSRSTDNGEHWELALKDEDASYNTKFINGCFVAIRMDGNWIGPIDHYPQNILTSTDNGKTWKRFDGGLLYNQRIYDLEEAGGYLYCSHKTGVSRSVDKGKTWALVGSTAIIGEPRQFELMVSGQIVFAVAFNWGC